LHSVVVQGCVLTVLVLLNPIYSFPDAGSVVSVYFDANLSCASLPDVKIQDFSRASRGLWCVLTSHEPRVIVVYEGLTDYQSDDWIQSEHHHNAQERCSVAEAYVWL
jgi:hypothetical protein